MRLNLEEYFHPVPGSEQEKEIVLFARRHWVSFLGQILLSFFLLIIPPIVVLLLVVTGENIFQGTARNFIVIGMSIYYLVAVTFTFAAWITYYYDIYIVTKDTIVDVSQLGFFGRKISQLSLLRVQDVSSNIKGFLPTLFAYGDVLIETAGEQSETFLFEAVPNPQAFSAKVLELHNQLIEKETRQKDMLEAEGVVAPTGATTSSQPTEVCPPCEPQEKKEALPQEKTTYQKLLEKDLQEEKEGEVSKDDLNQGGEVKL